MTMKTVVKSAVLAVVAATALTACNRERAQDRVLFDGLYYRADASSTRDNRMDFTISVRPVTQGLDGARAAGAYEATKHCIEFFGNSDLVWDIAPDAETPLVEGDSLILKGACTP